MMAIHISLQTEVLGKCRDAAKPKTTFCVKVAGLHILYSSYNLTPFVKSDLLPGPQLTVRFKKMEAGGDASKRENTVEIRLVLWLGFGFLGVIMVMLFCIYPGSWILDTCVKKLKLEYTEKKQKQKKQDTVAHRHFIQVLKHYLLHVQMHPHIVQLV